MSKKIIPLAIEGINESIYAGFWLRLVSLLLDFLIMVPVILITLYLNGLSKIAYYLTVIPSFVFHFWYSIYLVKKYGGTPGKLITGIKILRTDGLDIGWKEAILRNIVTFSLSIFISVVTIIALTEANTAYYESLDWMKKEEYLMTFTPVLFIVYTWLSNIWIYSELFVLLLNKRKRAIHDFLANTVIVRAKYIDKIRASIN